MRISDWRSDVCSSDLLARIGDVLQRMKALAAQSLSGVPTDTERGFIDAEYQQLIAEIDDMSTTTRFNGASLLDGGTGAMPAADYFVGTDVNDVNNVDFGTLSGSASYTSTPQGLDRKRPRLKHDPTFASRMPPSALRNKQTNQKTQ